MIFTILVSVAAHATPTLCHFNPIGGKTGYNLAGAYMAATIVAVGEADAYDRDQPQKVRITKSIKGDPPKVITLTGIHSNGTDPWGAAINPHRPTLIFLAGPEPYRWVDEGSACPNAFELKDGKVEIGRKTVPVEGLKKFLDTLRDPI